MTQYSIVCPSKTRELFNQAHSPSYRSSTVSTTLVRWSILLANTTIRMGKNPRGLFRFIKPPERKKVRKDLGKSLSKFVRTNMDSFAAYRELRRTIDEVLY